MSPGELIFIGFCSIAEKFPAEKAILRWIRNVIIIISALWIIFAVYCLETFTHTSLTSEIIEPLYYSILIYWMLFIELRNGEITCINNFISRYKSLITDYIIKNELFKDHTISLGKLAKSLSMTPHIVSQVINEQLSCNFATDNHNCQISELFIYKSG